MTIKSNIYSRRLKTHEFNGKASVLQRVFLHPDILKVTQRSLIRIVLSMVGDHGMIHQRDRPKIRDRFSDLTAPPIDRTKHRLSLSLCEREINIREFSN
jgi:hypothetical protein